MSDAAIQALHDRMAELARDIEALKKDDDTPREAGRFVKFDVEKRLVYAEVYLPDVEDAHGHSMTRTEIEKMAHSFMANARTMQIDYNHDNNTDYGCYMVESFIARDGDPDYAAGAWVGVVYVGSDDLWGKIKNGEITGFSFEGLGYVREVE
jgi:hypothetical protein